VPEFTGVRLLLLLPADPVKATAVQRASVGLISGSHARNFQKHTRQCVQRRCCSHRDTSKFYTSRCDFLVPVEKCTAGCACCMLPLSSSSQDTQPAAKKQRKDGLLLHAATIVMLQAKVAADPTAMPDSPCVLQMHDAVSKNFFRSY